jgi:hypothetical protein
MTFRPRYPCVIKRQLKSFDSFGRPKFNTMRVKTRCDVVYIKEGGDRTTVREDSSASRGRAEEYVNDARLLLNPREGVKLGDVIEVQAFGELGDANHLRVMRVWRRPDISGRIHHIEIDCDRYAPEDD